MKRVLSFLCAVTMILTMCTFYMGEALSVAAEEAPEVADENVEYIETYEELIAKAKDKAYVGKTLTFANDIIVSDWTVEPLNKEDMTVTGTNGTDSFTISLAKDTFGEVTGTLPANPDFYLTLENGVNIDGNGKVIKGIIIVNHKEGEATNVSLFNTVSAKSTVKDVVLEDSLFVAWSDTGTARVAALAFTVDGGKVIDCETEADLPLLQMPQLRQTSAVL